MADNIFDLIAEQIRETIEQPSDYRRDLPQQNDALIQNALTALDNATQQITNADDLGQWLSAANNWKEGLADVARTAFDRAQSETRQALDDLFIRYLQTHMPRTAATLVLVGVITTTTDPTTGRTTQQIDYQKLEQFIRDPETLINEQFWEDLFDDVGHPMSGRLPAVLAGLIIMAPQTIIALAQNNLKVSDLPAPLTRSDPTSPWGGFRAVSENWIAATLPIGDPTKDPELPAGSHDFSSDMEPDLSATLAIRSNRYQQAAQWVTDFEMWLAFAINQDEWVYDLGSSWFVSVKPGVSVGFGRDSSDGSWHGAFAALEVGTPEDPSESKDEVTISIGRDRGEGVPDISLGPPYDTRLTIQDLGAAIIVRENAPVFEFKLWVEELVAFLAPRWLRTFGETNNLLREGARFELDLAFTYKLGEGITLNLSSGFEVLFYIDKQFGGDSLNVKLHSIRFIGELLATEDNLQGRVNIRFHVSGQLGPVGLVLDGFGAWLGWWPEFNDDTGQNEMTWWGLLPPTGAGLIIAVGPVVGGGFLDWTGGPTERYAGLIYVKIFKFEVTAFGIHERTPDGDTSLIIVLGARFFPGIQLGFGFAITGIGGLFGYNRRADTDALRERLTSGATGNILFAPDPVKNAPTILGDLDFIFPAASNIFVFGPTMQISWLEVIVRFDIGLIFEIATGTNIYGTTGLTKIILLGTARHKIALGDLVVNDINFQMVGFVDFPQEIIEFDATLISSKVMIYFVITGDVAFRLSWGAQPYVMLSMGGFHPDFKPEPLVHFPEMVRLGLFYKTPSDVGLWLRLEFYLAITSNSFQLGSLIEVGIKAGSINATGWVGFDALIQFDPFYFSISYSAGFRVRWKSYTLAGIKVRGTITGPGPITITGRFCIEILFWDICWSDSFTLGSSNQNPAIGTTTSSLRQALEPELSRPENIEAIGTEDGLVTANSQAIDAADNCAVISPIGRLQWAQKRAPLDTLIERFEGGPLASPQAVTVHSPAGDGGIAKDWFSPGTYTNLTDSEALNRASFDRLQAGLTLGFNMQSSAPVGRNIQVVIFYLPRPTPVLLNLMTIFPSLLLGLIDGRTAGTSDFEVQAATIRVHDESWVVHTAGSSQANLSQTDAHQRARYNNGTAVVNGDMIELDGI